MTRSATTRLQLAIMAVSIALTVGLAYWQAVPLPFVQDDFGILQSFQHHEISLISLLKSFIPGTTWIFYRPLAGVCFLAMHEAFGDNAIGFHLVALTIHFLNSCLTGMLIFSITRDRVISYGVALVYAAAVAVHLDVMSWIVGMYDLGGAFFFLLSMKLFIDRKIGWSGVAWFAGCLFKESVIVLPAILFLYELLLAKHERGQKYWIVRQPKGLVLFLLLAGLAAATKLYQLSAVSHSDSAPYSLSLDSVASNIFLYLKWMSQSLFSSGEAGLGVSLLVIAGCLVFSWTERNRSDKGRQGIFLMGWACFGLLPVIFLTHHSYRYYAVYSLPAYVCFFLLLTKAIATHISNSAKIADVLIVACCLIATATSIVESNEIYREGPAEITFVYGTNHLISRSKVVNIVHDGLKKYVPVMPGGAVILIGGADLDAIGYSTAPQYWYDDKEIRVYDLAALRSKNGQLYIENKEQGQVAPSGKILVDPSRILAFALLNGVLVKAAASAVVSR